MSRFVWSLLVALAVVPTAPAPAPAQKILRPAIGGAVGVAGGGVVTLSVIVARARWQREYLDSVEDLIHWQSIPMIAAPAAGVIFGLAGEDALRGSIIGSTSGLVVGAAVGSGLGWLLSDKQEWPWAGGVIGAGVGLTVGGLAGGLRAWSREESPGIEFPDFLRLGFSVPVGP